MQPLIGTPPLNRNGIIMGIDMRLGTPFFIDPWRARFGDDRSTSNGRRRLTGTTTRIKGERDSGKSTFNKVLTTRGRAYQVGLLPRELRGLDPKGPTREGIGDIIDEDMLDVFRTHLFDQKPHEGEAEYGAVTEMLHGTTIRPAVQGVNPFDWTMNDELSMVDIGINLCETSLTRNVRNYEPLGVQVAVSTMFNNYREKSSPELLRHLLMHQGSQELTDYFRLHASALAAQLKRRYDNEPEPSGALQHLIRVLEQEEASEHNIPVVDFERDSGLMGVQMNRIAKGDFGILSGDSPTIKELFGKRVLRIDRTGMSPKARIVFDALSIRWQTWVLDNNLRSLMPHLRIGDEEADNYESLMYLRWYEEFSRKSRAFHTWDCRAVQHGNRLDNAGEPGSEVRNLATSIKQGLGIVINFSIPPEEALIHELTLDGMSDADAEMHVGLPPGCGSIKAANMPLRFFQLRLMKSEIPLVQSNAATEAVLDRHNIWTLEQVRKRAADRLKRQSEPGPEAEEVPA
jgi:hypothetical protein